MTNNQFILASASPRRKELLEVLNLPMPVSVFSVDADESIDSRWTPSEAVEKLSLQKLKLCLIK